MAQADQTVQNATFPAVRADINDNLAALFSQSSGPSAPAVTVAYQPWIDTSSSPAVWKVRNATNTGWVTIGTIDATTGFASGGITPIANGGTGQTTASAALTALLPSQAGNAGKGLTTDGTIASWGVIAAGASIQSFTSSSTYTPTSGKTTFLVFATGGGGGSGSAAASTNLVSGGGGGGGTAIRLYTSAEMGASASVTIGAGGTAGSQGTSTPGGAGGSTVFTPAGTGLAITGAGGSGSATPSISGGGGGGSTNSLFGISGQKGGTANNVAGGGGNNGASFWIGGRGTGGAGVYNTSSGQAGTAGVVMVLEW